MPRLLTVICALCAARLTVTETPRAQHYAKMADKGEDVVISLPGYDPDGDPLSATITSLPDCSSQGCRKGSAGKLYQLSQVFEKHGHGPKTGTLIKVGDKLTAKGNRLVYVRPKNDRQPQGQWAKFKYTVSEKSAHTNSAILKEDAAGNTKASPRGPVTTFVQDGSGDWKASGHATPGTSTEGVVTMTASSGKVTESAFATNADSWTIVNTDGLLYNGIHPALLKRTEAYLYNADAPPAHAGGNDARLHREEGYKMNTDGHRTGVPTSYKPVTSGGKPWDNEKFATGVALPTGPNGDANIALTSAEYVARESFMYGDAQYQEAGSGGVNTYNRVPVAGHGTDSQGYMFDPTSGGLTAGGSSDNANVYSHLQTHVGTHPSNHLSQAGSAGQLAGTIDMNSHTIMNKGEHQLHNYRKGQPMDPAYYGAQSGEAATPAHYKFKDHRGPVFYPISERAHANTAKPKWERSSRGKDLSQYIHHTDKDIKVDNGGSDEKLWYFVAPPKFLSHQGITYGGSLHFTQSASTGDFAPGNMNHHPALVILECATCKDVSASTAEGAQYNKGVRLVYHSSQVFDGTTTKFQVDFKTGLWYKDPKNVLNDWAPATECELIEVLSHMTGMYILGDHTKWYETVAMDNVYTTAGSLPIAFSQKQAGGEVSPTTRSDCYIDYTCRQTGDC
jgi:hypothetical protein